MAELSTEQRERLKDSEFAYVDRGTCSFAIKAQNVQNAGATGMIAGNNVPGPPLCEGL